MIRPIVLSIVAVVLTACGSSPPEPNHPKQMEVNRKALAFFATPEDKARLKDRSFDQPEYVPQPLTFEEKLCDQLLEPDAVITTKQEACELRWCNGLTLSDVCENVSLRASLRPGPRPPPGAGAAGGIRFLGH